MTQQTSNGPERATAPQTKWTLGILGAFLAVAVPAQIYQQYKIEQAAKDPANIAIARKAKEEQDRKAVLSTMHNFFGNMRPYMHKDEEVTVQIVRAGETNKVTMVYSDYIPLEAQASSGPR